MTRRFDGRPVPRDLIEAVLRDSQKAPSAGGSQGFGFLVLEGEELELFWKLTEGGVDATYSNAPVVVLPLANKSAYLARYSEPDKQGIGFDKEENWPAPYWIVDTSFASMIVLLSATAHGLGAWFFTMISGVPEVLDAFDVPREFEPLGAIAIGHPDAGPQPGAGLAKARAKDFAQLVHWGSW